MMVVVAVGIGGVVSWLVVAEVNLCLDRIAVGVGDPARTAPAGRSVKSTTVAWSALK